MLDLCQMKRVFWAIAITELDRGMVSQFLRYADDTDFLRWNAVGGRYLRAHFYEGVEYLITVRID